MNKTPLKQIGLSLFDTIDKIYDVDKFDVKMDFCVMSESVWKII